MTWTRRVFRSVAVLLLLGAASEGVALASEELELDLPELQRWTLDNGLEVAYMHYDKAPVVTVQVWYRVGSKEEPEGRTGMAHMFEHMLFKGTTNVRPEEHARLLDKLGGNVNAFTSFDTTAYHNTLPANYADFACQLEAERMRNLVLRQSMVDTEREVVKEELRVRQENTPIGKALRDFFDTAFTTHPYRWMPIGSKEDLDATSVADLQKFYDTYYVPNNALLVLVGDIDRGTAEACATSWFGDISRAADPPRPAAALPEPAQKELRRKMAEPGQVGLVLGGYHIPEAKNADTLALEVLGSILSDGQSSRLHRRLVRDDGIAVAASGQVFRLRDPGLFLLFGVFLEAGQGDKVERTLLAEIARVRDEGVTAKELQKAKNQQLASFVFGLQSATGLAQQIGMSWINTDGPGAFLEELGEVDKVTRDDIQRVARQYLVESNLTLVTIPPKGAQ